MKRIYLLTDKAGLWVAGFYVPALPERKLELSDRAAAYELSLGTIELAPFDAAPKEEPEQKKTRRKADKAPEATQWNGTQPLASTSTE
ncbi:hypothetical protein [Brucella pseudogrignonensis]|uniref:Uncharacterized protein n=1 Tax=Brucella pseudogrignonensis TaxID=419475 RepID=A0ABU1M5G8_9HYPH|nr:hypothetical protein [Brucella pseudogrignonensis]MDR6431303.1 hypothetical protein [Brucella pseudogrignonensis]